MTVPSLDPARYVREIEQAAWDGNWNLRYLSPCASAARPWLHRASYGAPAPRLYLSAGIHGDEISGPLAVLEMLRRPNFFAGFDTTIFPMLNPDGIARGTRGNADGIDLNRDYKDTKSREIRSHRRALDTLAPFAGAMYLHEDFEETGAYLYELNEVPELANLGSKIIKAMSAHVPIDLRPEIEEVAAWGGVLQRRDLIEKFGPIEERPEWPEAIYLGLHHTKLSFTTETPMLQPLENRVAAQIAAVSTLMHALLEEG